MQLARFLSSDSLTIALIGCDRGQGNVPFFLLDTMFAEQKQYLCMSLTHALHIALFIMKGLYGEKMCKNICQCLMKYLEIYQEIRL